MSKVHLKYFYIILLLSGYQLSITKGLIGVNVRLAQQGEFHFIVSIAGLRVVSRSRIHSQHRCTGSLVTRQDVLTAEHCLRNRLTDGFRVLIGSHDLTRTTDYFPLFLWTYEQWAIFIRRPIDKEIYHDIAFIKLTTNVPDNFTLVPYGNMENQLLYGLTVQTAGFGRLANGSKSRFLRTADLTVLTQEDCESRVSIMRNRLLELDRMRLCTVADPYAVTTRGDSGGPLLYFGTLVAINHGIIPKMDEQVTPDHVNVHISIRYYQDFFEDIRVRFYMNFEN